LLCIAPVKAEVSADTNWARNAGWCEHSGVRFSEYAAGEALSNKGTVRGHWLADDALARAETSAHMEDGITWMYLHAPTCRQRLCRGASWCFVELR